MDYLLQHKKFFIIAPIILLIILVVYFGICLYIMLNAERITFDNARSKNIDYGQIKYSIDFIKDSKGEKIEVMTVPSLDPKNKDNIILHFHGNSGRIPKILQQASTLGTVVSPSYPGWSVSEGDPTSDKIYETVDLTMKYLHDKEYQNSQITVLGHSLGGSPAVYAAAHYPNLKKTIVVNTFYSMQAMCETKYGPLCLLGGNFLNTAKYAPDVKGKYRQFNNVHDDLIPYPQASRLFLKIGSEDKKYSDIDGTHGDFDVIKVLQTE